jgi:hypothetical protein
MTGGAVGDADGGAAVGTLPPIPELQFRIFLKNAMEGPQRIIPQH